MPRALRALALLSVLAAACADPTDHPRIELNAGLGSVDVRGLASTTLSRVAARPPDDPSWPSLLRVTTRGAPADAPPVAGRYAVDDGALRFTPLFPLDPGREYDVRLDLSSLALSTASLNAVVSLPGTPPAAATVVSAVYPSGNRWPANQLRVYVHFSQPMDRRSGAGLVTLLDERGEDVKDAFLPLDVDLWNEDQTRYTVFFDPGRVKRGILPNRQMGRALESGRRYTLVVRPGWRDGHGQPLAAEFRRTFTAVAPVEAALTMGDWRLELPGEGTTAPLVVRFPAPLDHSLLRRALLVRRQGATVEGEIDTDAGETVWRFVPAAAWSPGTYELQALPILEDVAGNRVGRAFEVEADREDESAPPAAPATRTFTIAR